MFIDSHCHIHESEFFPDTMDQEGVYKRAIKADVAMLCVATSGKASREALDFVKDHDQTWAVLGVHPHESTHGVDEVGELLKTKANSKVVGIGEIGLDYYYENSPRNVQRDALEQQLQWAVDYNLPVSFHVRDSQGANDSVWDDFWPILDNFHGVRGVLHSFTDTRLQLEKGFGRGLYVGINGISTFTKDQSQQAMYASIPLEMVLLETDAPFLTPAPLRGKINEPSYVVRVAEHLAVLRDVPVTTVAAVSTDNAKRLFTI